MVLPVPPESAGAGSARAIQRAAVAREPDPTTGKRQAIPTMCRELDALALCAADVPFLRGVTPDPLLRQL